MLVNKVYRNEIARKGAGDCFQGSSSTFAFILLMVFAEAAVSCPLCHTATGTQVRAGIFGADFGFNLLMTTIPFIICLGITVLIYFGVPSGRDGVEDRRVTEFQLRAYPKRGAE